MVAKNWQNFLRLCLILFLIYIHSSNASVVSLSAAAAGGANGGGGGIRSREEGREVFVMQASSATIGVILVIGFILAGYKWMKMYNRMKMEEKGAALFEDGKLQCPKGNTIIILLCRSKLFDTRPLF